MPPKKQKAQKMALADFFADTTGGSWADEMESIPTAPAQRENTGPRRGEPGYLESMPDRASRGPGGPGGFSGMSGREELPLPDVPPFTAFVGNLTFETDEAELRDFFGQLQPISVRLVKDPQGKPKGFGYVEFPSRDGLQAGLDLSGQSLGGRSIRVNVAEAPAGTRRDFTPSAADEASQWRRATPLPAREAAAGGAGAPTRRANFSPTEPGPERDWGAARGAKFVPAPPVSSGYGGSGGFGSREPREPREHREPRESPAPTAADEAGQWRSARPLVEATPAPAPAREARDARPTGLADTESTWSRGTKVRSSNPPSGESSPQAPPSRPRINLLPRGAATSATPSPDTTPPTSAKSSPFGAARPVDSAARDREAAERLEEKKKQREAEVAAKAKAKEEAEKAKAAAAAAAAAAAEEKRKLEREKRPARVHPSRLNSANSNSNGPAPSTAPAKEAKGAKAAQAATTAATDDGFEAVSSGRTRGAHAAASTTESTEQRKPTVTKAGFSFAAAASALQESAGNDDDDEVDDAADKVAEVAI